MDGVIYDIAFSSEIPNACQSTVVKPIRNLVAGYGGRWLPSTLSVNQVLAS